MGGHGLYLETAYIMITEMDGRPVQAIITCINYSSLYNLLTRLLHTTFRYYLHTLTNCSLTYSHNLGYLITVYFWCPVFVGKQ